MIQVFGIDLADGYWWAVNQGMPLERGQVSLELWTVDEAKTKAYEDSISALAEIIGLPRVQIMERLWAIKERVSPSFWNKRVTTAWFDRKLVEGLEL